MTSYFNGIITYRRDVKDKGICLRWYYRGNYRFIVIIIILFQSTTSYDFKVILK